MSSQTVLTKEEIVKYFKDNKTELHILTPCYGSMLFVQYTSCLLNTVKLLESIGITVVPHLLGNESLVQRARNRLVCDALEFPNLTHVLFIDADISWNPQDIIKLLIQDKDIVGAAYPFKHYFLNNINKDFLDNIEKRNQGGYNKNIDSESFLKHNLLKYNLNYKEAGVEVENNLLVVKHIPTGFMMIKKHVFEQMKEKCDIGYKSIEDNGRDRQFYAFFDCGVKDGRYLSEDWFFCDRWKELGGKIYISPDIVLKHTGLCHYEGRLLSQIS